MSTSTAATPFSVIDSLRMPKRDVIAIMNTGGTFSARTRMNADHRDTTLSSKYETTLRDVISNNLDRHLQSLYGLSRSLRTRASEVLIDWIEVHPSDYIFSENATPSYWLRLVDRLREYVVQSEDRIVGIIVIHGTDTLASATAAMQFMIATQSMPIIFVAANRPLQDDFLQDGRLSRFSSDAWPNLLQAITFILLAGHSYRRVALSFASRLHYPVNVRKVPGAGTASSDQLRPHLHGFATRPEAFVFRNLLMGSPFLCQDITGYWCSDQSAVWPAPTTSDTEDNVLSLYLPANDDSLHWIDHVMEHLHATSSPSSSDSMERGVRVAMVETFASGTIPTDPLHPLARSLRNRRDAGQLLVLSGPYGIDLTQCYDQDALNKAGIRCLRIGPLIPESAGPLVATAAAKVTLSDRGMPLSEFELKLRAECTSLVSNLTMVPSATGGVVMDSIGATHVPKP